MGSKDVSHQVRAQTIASIQPHFLSLSDVPAFYIPFFYLKGNHKVSLDDRLCGTWITSFLEYAEQVESPDRYKMWVAVSAISSALGRKCFMSLGDLKTYPNTYIVLVGPAGIRKSTAIGSVESMVRELNIVFASDECSRQQLITEMIGSGVFDEYSEQNQSTLTVFPDEFTLFLGQRATMIEKIVALTRWFDCPPGFKYTLRGQTEEIIENCWITILASTTPSGLEAILSDEISFGGFMSRVMTVYADIVPKFVHVPRYDTTLSDMLLNDLLIINDMRGEFTVTDSFIKAHIDFRENPPEFHTHKKALIAEYAMRRDLHLRKLAMIFSASRSNDMVVDLIDFEMALDVLQDYEQALLRMFDAVSGLPYRACLRAMQLFLDKYFKTNDLITYKRISQEFAMEFPLEDIATCIEVLAKARKIGAKKVDGESVLIPLE